MTTIKQVMREQAKNQLFNFINQTSTDHIGIVTKAQLCKLLEQMQKTDRKVMEQNLQAANSDLNNVKLPSKEYV